MNISMAVQTPACKESVFTRRRRTTKRMKVRIWVDWMASNIVAALAKEGHLSNEKPAMVTPVDFVAD